MGGRVSLDALLVAGFSSREFQTAVDLGSRRQIVRSLASLLVAYEDYRRRVNYTHEIMLITSRFAFSSRALRGRTAQRMFMQNGVRSQRESVEFPQRSGAGDGV